jgi:hypothetical protein
MNDARASGASSFVDVLVLKPFGGVADVLGPSPTRRQPCLELARS